MNTTATFIEENNNDHESDSDDATPEYYQPISALADDADSDPDEEQHDESVENGISSLHLNDGVEEHKSSSSSSDGEEKEGEEEESVRVREREEAAILRAFREDESRRNAPLSQENASRVIEAMRGISFSGSTPDWAGRVPQDEWILHLQTLRRQQQQQVSFTTD